MSTQDSPRGQREHFVPLRKAELIRILADEPGMSARDTESFLALCRLLDATFHHQFHEQFEEVRSAYAIFDPDRDTQPLTEIGPDERERHVSRLFDLFEQLLERANFRRLTRDELQAAIGASSEWGVRLKVDLDSFRRLEVFGRGDLVGRRSLRRWRRYYRLQEVDVPVYLRLVVIFRLQEHKRLHEGADTDAIYIKLFKNIPKQDMDMLLPGSRVRMTLVDHGRILLPTLSGVGMAVYKLIQGAVIVAFTGLAGLLSFAAFVCGTLGYGAKSFFGYLRTKDKYHLNLTRSLYYQNLDNNAGVLFRILDEAEKQEFHEAVLAYFLLWRHAGEEGWTESQIDCEAEKLLREAIGVDVDFDVHDAMAKLRRLGLVQSLPGDRWRAIDVRSALSELDRAWDDYFRHD